MQFRYRNVFRHGCSEWNVHTIGAPNDELMREGKGIYARMSTDEKIHHYCTVKTALKMDYSESFLKFEYVIIHW